MDTIGVTLDLTQWNRYQIALVSEAHRKRILGLTSEGVDAFGEVFHHYGTQQFKVRTKLGYGTDVKNLRITGGLLDGMKLEGDTLSVDAVHQKIAAGQMSGGGGKWAYTHHFLDASDETNELAGHALADELNYELGIILQ